VDTSYEAILKGDADAGDEREERKFKEKEMSE
jgi:hypothetical protein